MEQGIEKVLAALREAAPHILEAARRAVLADILNGVLVVVVGVVGAWLALRAARRAKLTEGRYDDTSTLLYVLSTCCTVVAALATLAVLNMWLAIDWYTLQYALKVGR
jgi:hypothetical protein